MAADHIKAEKDYVKGMKYKDIAEKYGVSLNTVKSWKKRYGWTREKGAHKEKGVHTKNKRGAPIGNINAKGNKGGSAPKGNQNALKHGFFSKYIPQETLEIMGMLGEKSPADLVWDQIMIQYAAIIRAQKIMFVQDKNEMIKELKKEKTELEVSKDPKGNVESIPTYVEREYEFQFAWDRHATFLNAQSRAMSELRSLIKQFEEMASMDDERRLKLEQMRLGIEKTKAEVEKISSGSDDKPIEILIKRKGKGEDS
ncbi:ATPase subunit of terminase family protein [Anoxybacillus sp. B7M1]|uniref:phage terminase small subunit n=1 Tax=unclassified Anoxybacillus TaxID=2639704 RepID=UPI0005CCAE6E|nr:MULTISPECIES: phage terminase small subunit [unclassified Anoxybacillus]ANB55970.1 ATPase subunit of terminase family protein [Anoxybacillus sp. B2M1]ANB65022.1 ATPase subunit of terminase family protein [Anoxybacillus sp. B7M1]